MLPWLRALLSLVLLSLVSLLFVIVRRLLSDPKRKLVVFTGPRILARSGALACCRSCLVTGRELRFGLKINEESAQVRDVQVKIKEYIN